MSKLRQVAEGVRSSIDVAEYAGGSGAPSFQLTFDPVLEWTPDWTPSELSEPRVAVVPEREERDLESRGADLVIYSVLVGIQHRLGSGAIASQDAIVKTLEQIADWLRANQIDVEGVKFEGMEIVATWDADHARQHRVGTSALRIRYQERRPT